MRAHNKHKHTCTHTRTHENAPGNHPLFLYLTLCSHLEQLHAREVGEEGELEKQRSSARSACVSDLPRQHSAAQVHPGIGDGGTRGEGREEPEGERAEGAGRGRGGECEDEENKVQMMEWWRRDRKAQNGRRRLSQTNGMVGLAQRAGGN